MRKSRAILAPPNYCSYPSGECDQHPPGSALKPLEAFFIYPSQPPHLARTVAQCVQQLRTHSSPECWVSWEDLSVGGQIIFCRICEAIRCAKVIVANITTTNFNVLFELGYAIGAGKPVLPVRDSSYEKDRKLFDEIGIFDTLGYRGFHNSNDLASIVTSKQTYSPPITRTPSLNRHQPIYYVRSPIDTDGSIKLLSCLKKGYFRFRTFDCREVSRLSLHEGYKQAVSSLAVVAHLIDPDRTGATVHNSRAAFVCGMAMAAGKHVLMLQEGSVAQPIDYRDVIVHYTDPSDIPFHYERLARSTAETFQTSDESRVPLPEGLLERLDLGDVAAENEISALRRYFVKTPQFQQARQGHARLVIGRKGTGKTALFYGVRRHFSHHKKWLVLDLKPEGHQFTKLREVVLQNLSEGLQQHTLTAFWYYLLLLEITNKLIERERPAAYRDPESLAHFNELQRVWRKHTDQEGDFSERLMALVNHLVERFPRKAPTEIRSPDITEAVYGGEARELSDIAVQYLQRTDGVYVLFDNIDKGFPTHGLSQEDVSIVRCLLEATRKMQRALERRQIDSLSTVFVRRDVFDLLVDRTPDRGKESCANLDWSDTELIKELLLKRFQYEAPELKGSFEDVWGRLFDPHVARESSFTYIVSRTFLRPRDILNLVRRCIQVAVSRGHTRVEQDDIMSAEAAFSEDMLNDLRYEIRDVFPDTPDLLLEFLDAEATLSREDIDLRLMSSGVPEDRFEDVRDLLLWFSFLGVKAGDDERYAFQYLYNVPKLKALVKETYDYVDVYTIHPAFRKALAL